jgi:hypothetical protein
MDSLSLEMADDAAVAAACPGVTYSSNSNGGIFEYGTSIVDPLCLVGEHTGDISVADG